MTQSTPMSRPNPSFIPYELVLGWRYTRAGRATRRNGFISFISGVSMLGISLGVAALIIVLSVMNGFQKEVRDRMLGVVSHIEVYAPDGGALPDAAATLAQALTHPDVVAGAPFVAAQALIARGEDMKGAVVRGIDPALDGAVTDLSLQLSPAVREQLQAGRFGVVLGSELARSLGVRVGEPGDGDRAGRANHPSGGAAALETNASGGCV
jgi:lipoprotein-releasing system permease protein